MDGSLQPTTTLLSDQGTLMGVDPAIVHAARNDHITDDDMLHPYRHTIRLIDVDELTMPVGADAAGRLLGSASPSPKGVDFIVHAMPARAKFLDI